jgi:hypothetical protein
LVCGGASDAVSVLELATAAALTDGAFVPFFRAPHGDIM